MNIFTTTLTFIYGIALFIFATYLLLSILMAVDRKAHNQSSMDDSKTYPKNDNLFYAFIIPAFEEGAVIKNTLRELTKFKFNGIIYVVDDASSDDTLAQIAKVKDPRIQVIKRQLPYAQQGKGVSLNVALDAIRAHTKANNISDANTIVGVIDADAVLSDNAMSKLNQYFSNPKENVIQLRVKMFNNVKNTLQVAQDAEFFTVNNYSQVMRMSTNTVGLSGNGQFFRLAPILKGVGEHPWGTALLDDYELTIKLMSAGIKVHYVDQAYVYQESVSDFKRFIRQRSRWVQGNLDCLKYVKQIKQSKNITMKQKIGIAYFLAQPWINLVVDLIVAVLSINTAIIVGKAMINGNATNYGIAALILFIFSMFWGLFFLIAYLGDLKTFKQPKPKLTHLIMLPFAISYMYVVLFFSILIAFWRYVTNQNSWLKTTRETN